MDSGLSIKCLELDPDYLGLEICAWTARYSGTTRIYAGLDELAEFSARIAGFPVNGSDVRTYSFGSLEPQSAGGYCMMRLFCLDGLGRAAIEVELREDAQRFAEATVKLSFWITAGAIDRFVEDLGKMELLPGAVAALVPRD